MDFLTDRIKPIYFKYLSASFGTAMIASIYSIVDVAMVGQYQGPEGTAALAVVAPAWNIIYSLGLLMGAVVLAQAYMRPIKYVFPLYLFNQVVAAFLRNDKSPGLATLGVLCGGIFNIFGDYFFVFTCFLFRPRKSRERRRKRSHTNVSNTLVARPSTPPAQTAHVRFRTRKRVHTCLHQQDRTQRLTRRNRGVLDGGAITTLGAFCAVRKPCAAGCQNGKLCRFWALVGCAPEERRKPAGQRCAYARRCPEASRPRWAA